MENVQTGDTEVFIQMLRGEGSKEEESCSDLGDG